MPICENPSHLKVFPLLRYRMPFYMYHRAVRRIYIYYSSWRIFDIEEFDITGTDVKSAVAGDDAKEVARYTVNGQRIKSSTRGINIVKYDDGTVKRVVVK